MYSGDVIKVALFVFQESKSATEVPAFPSHLHEVDQFSSLSPPIPILSEICFTRYFRQVTSPLHLHLQAWTRKHPLW